MSKIPSFKRLNKNDFKAEYSDLIDKLVLSLNSIIDSIVIALDKKVSLKNNILCSVRDITIVVGAQGTPSQPVNITYDFVGNASVVTVGKVTNLSNPVGYPSSGVSVYWEQINSNTIQIKHVTGILANNSHTLRLVIYGDET